MNKQLETLRTQAGKSIVTAPFSGVIDEVMPTEGEVGGPQVPICHIIGLEKLTVVGNISESYLKSIQEGSDVEIIIPSLDTTLTDLKIDRVSKYVNPGNRTYKVFVDVENTTGVIIPNLVARIKVKDESIENALTVQSSAIQYNKDGNTYLFTADKKDTATVTTLHWVKHDLFIWWDNRY